MSGWSLSRRTFLKTGLALTALAGKQAGADEGPRRPNILVIMPDQMRGDCLSAVGHPAVRTPHIDALAEEGALFRRGYAEVPSCIPARYAYLTGMSPQASGVVGYNTSTRLTRHSMPQLFQDAGYFTVLVGRSMHQQNTDEELGYELVLQGSAWSTRQEDYRQYLEERLPPDTPLGQVLHEDGFRSMAEEIGVTYNHWQAEPWPLEEEWHPINWVARESRELLEETDAERPVFLTTSFYAPHPPLFPAERLFDAYIEKELPEPATGAWVDWDALSPPPGSHGGSRVRLEGDTLRRAQAGYFGLIEQIDETIAPLIADFKARSEEAGRPWIVLLTSEHGEMLGDHGYFRKCEPYEGSANVPYIVAASEDLGFERGMRSNEPVGLQDVLPTLADLSGVSIPDDVDGLSLVPYLRGETQEVRPWLHFEHHPTYSDQQAFHALTDGRYKYIWRTEDGSEQLFDLDADPMEERDLALESAEAYQELLQQWRQRLIERLEPRPEGFSDGEQLIAGQPYQAHQPGTQP